MTTPLFASAGSPGEGPSEEEHASPAFGIGVGGDGGKGLRLGGDDDGWTTVQKKHKNLQHSENPKARVLGVAPKPVAITSGVVLAPAPMPPTSDRVPPRCDPTCVARPLSLVLGSANSSTKGDNSAEAASLADQALSSLSNALAASTAKKSGETARTASRRHHGAPATGVVKRRDEWQDHCLIEMADGLEDVFCHRHRCQGKALPPAGTRVRFKLHLSSKSLCWQSGFVTWDETDQHDARTKDDLLHGGKRAGLRGSNATSPDTKAAARKGGDFAPDRATSKENVPADGNQVLHRKLGDFGFGDDEHLFARLRLSENNTNPRFFDGDEDNTTASTAEPHREQVESPACSEPSADANTFETTETAQLSAWGVLPNDSAQALGDDDAEPWWETDRGWADSLMGKILANKQAQEAFSTSPPDPPGSSPLLRSQSPVQPPPGLGSSGGTSPQLQPQPVPRGLGGFSSPLGGGNARAWPSPREGDDEESSLRRDLLMMMSGGPGEDPPGVLVDDEEDDAVVYPRFGAQHLQRHHPLDTSQLLGRLSPSQHNHKRFSTLMADQLAPSTVHARGTYERHHHNHLADRITLRVVAVDEPKLPWLATADLPATRAAPVNELRCRIEAAVEAGNASAIQKLKRRRETRKRAKRGDHCRVEVVDRRGGAIRVDAFAVNAAGAGAALRAMLDANADALRRRSSTGTVDEAEMFANLGWAQLVSQLETILAKCEPDGICCNHLSRAFEKEFGSALVETLFGDFESLAALLRAPQLRGVVDLAESPGRPDLTVSLANKHRRRYADHVVLSPQGGGNGNGGEFSGSNTTPRGAAGAYRAGFPLALKPAVSPTMLTDHRQQRSRSVASSYEAFSSPQHRGSTISEPSTLAGLSRPPPMLPALSGQDPSYLGPPSTLFDRSFLGGVEESSRPRSLSAPSAVEITRAVSRLGLQTQDAAVPQF